MKWDTHTLFEYPPGKAVGAKLLKEYGVLISALYECTSRREHSYPQTSCHRCRRRLALLAKKQRTTADSNSVLRPKYLGARQLSRTTSTYSYQNIITIRNISFLTSFLRKRGDYRRCQVKEVFINEDITCCSSWVRHTSFFFSHFLVIKIRCQD